MARLRRGRRRPARADSNSSRRRDRLRDRAQREALGSRRVAGRIDITTGRFVSSCLTSNTGQVGTIAAAEHRSAASDEITSERLYRRGKFGYQAGGVRHFAAVFDVETAGTQGRTFERTGR